MNAEEFVAAIKQIVHDGAITDICTLLERGPTGRKPPQHLVELSSWYRSLSKSEQQHVEHIIGEAVHAAIFGLFAVLDGVRTVEGIGEKTDFSLIGSCGGKTFTISTPDTFLHDIYQAQVRDSN